MLATLLSAGTASAQSQYQTTFEAGIGYARPGIGGFDMVSVLLQADDYLVETGIGIDVNGSPLPGSTETALSWLIRAALRPVVIGNTLLHVGGEFSLHTNSAVDEGDIGMLTSVGVLFGVSQPLADHLNVAVHVFPFVFEFGNSDTVLNLARAQLGAHILF
jgi:hypothetical protein